MGRGKPGDECIAFLDGHDIPKERSRFSANPRSTLERRERQNSYRELADSGRYGMPVHGRPMQGGRHAGPLQDIRD